MSGHERTYLIVEDRLLQVVEKPEHISTVLNVASGLLQRGQQLQRSLDARELAGRESAPSINGGPWHTALDHPGGSAPPRHLEVTRRESRVRLYARGERRPCF
jgi:hypothetical protein